MKKAILCVLLTLSMSVSAFALEVPTDTVVQNLNGSQQVIKTFTIPSNLTTAPSRARSPSTTPVSTPRRPAMQLRATP